MATCSGDQTVRIWELVIGASEINSSTATIMINSSETWFCTDNRKTYSGTVWKVMCANPEFDQVIAEYSFDRTESIWEEVFGEGQQQYSAGHASTVKPSPTHWIKRSILMDSRTSVIDVKFAPKHQGLMLAICSADGFVRICSEIFVGRIPRDCFEPELHPVFEKAGQVYDIRIIMDISGSNKGYCFVQFHTPEEAKKAIKTINNYEILPDEAPDVMNLTQLQHEIAVKFSAACLSWNHTYPISNPIYFFFPPMLAVGSDDPSTGGDNSNVQKVQIYELYENIRKWTKVDVIGLKLSEPVRDTVFAPNLGRTNHLVGVATKKLKILSIEPRLEDMRNPDSSIQTGGQMRFNVKLMAQSNEHNSNVWRVSWNVTGTILASSGDDGSVRLWKANHAGFWKCICTLKGDDGKINEIEGTAVKETTNGGMFTNTNNHQNPNSSGLFSPLSTPSSAANSRFLKTWSDNNRIYK